MVSFLKICKGIEQKASKSKFKYGHHEYNVWNSSLLSSLREAFYKLTPFFSEEQKESNTNLHFFPEGKIIFLSLARP